MKTKFENGELWNGDCLELMKEIPDNSIDLIVVDPPYTMTKKGKSCRPNYMKNNTGDNLFDGKLPDASKWMEQCYRVLKQNTHFYTFCNTNDLSDYLIKAKNVGFKFHNLITMIKDTNMPNRWYLKQCELILFFRKGSAKPINDMTSRDWIMCEMPKQSSGKIHITQKPLSLIEKLINNSSELDQTILDPFSGSGTTAIASINTNRKFICIEKDENYYKLSKERIENHNNIISVDDFFD